MVLNTQTQDKSYSRQSSPYASKSWKLEKKYWLLVIGAGCLGLFFWGSQITEFSLVKKTIELLPVVGGLCFAMEAIIKLVK